MKMFHILTKLENIERKLDEQQYRGIVGFPESTDYAETIKIALVSNDTYDAWLMAHGGQDSDIKHFLENEKKNPPGQLFDSQLYTFMRTSSGLLYMTNKDTKSTRQVFIAEITMYNNTKLEVKEDDAYSLKLPDFKVPKPVRHGSEHEPSKKKRRK